MTASTRGSSGLLGVNLSFQCTDLDQIPYQLGSFAEFADGKCFRWVRATAAKTAALLYLIDEDWLVGNGATTAGLDALPAKLGIPVSTTTAPTSLNGGATYTYFWIQTGGSMEATANADSAADALVYSTDTAGKVDDGDGTGNIIENVKWVDTVLATATGTIFAFGEMGYIGA